MALIRFERVGSDKTLEAQEFRSETLDIRVDNDGAATLHFVSEHGHPSLTVMLDPHTPEHESLRKLLAA